MASVPPDVISAHLRTREQTPTRATSADLLQAIGQGSEPAFEELRRRYRRAVERACRSIVGADVEDCAQEVFARIWRKAPLYDRGRGSAPAWLLTLARRTALNVRHTGAAPPTAVLVDEPAAAETADVVDRFWLQAALERLPERERVVIDLAYFDDLTQSRIATQLGVPLGSVKSWSRRGLNRLASLLGEESR